MLGSINLGISSSILNERFMTFNKNYRQRFHLYAIASQQHWLHSHMLLFYFIISKIRQRMLSHIIFYEVVD